MAASTRAVPHRRRRRGALLVGGVLAALSLLSLPMRSEGAVTPGTTSFPHGLVHLEGHGFGPGVGMGQWGAFGYAAVDHESYEWILSHFYGGTTLVTGTKKKADPLITVALVKDAGVGLDEPVVVTSTSAFRFGPVSVAAGHAAKAVLDRSTGTWSILRSHSCAGRGGWGKEASGVNDPVASLPGTAPARARLTVCFPSGETVTVRGTVEAYAEHEASLKEPVARVLNLVPLDDYVADVVPAESSTGWGLVGGAGPDGKMWGFQELEAQAVAARTYTLAYMAAGGWQGYADISDSPDCQSYPGTADEAPLTSQAVAETAGQYLVLHGEPAPTQYSASSGGYTVAGTFPAVPDAGDSVCLQSDYWSCNPNHSWTATIPVREVETTFPSIGLLEAISVPARNGFGQWGGRALSVLLVGSKGRERVSADGFQADFGLLSDWFRFTTSSTPSSAVTVRATGTGPLPRGPRAGSTGLRRSGPSQAQLQRLAG